MSMACINLKALPLAQGVRNRFAGQTLGQVPGGGVPQVLFDLGEDRQALLLARRQTQGGVRLLFA